MSPIGNRALWGPDSRVRKTSASLASLGSMQLLEGLRIIQVHHTQVVQGHVYFLFRSWPTVFSFSLYR